MRHLAVILGVIAAVVLHAAFLLFGGILIPKAKPPEAVTTPVDLLADVDEEKPKDKPEEQPAEDRQIASEDEPPPDAAEILRDMESQPSLDSAPALEAASLSAIEAALSGQGGGGDFAQSLSFESGGRIGGTGRGGPAEEKIDEAFSLTEIDQKPRAIFQASPNFPPQMRGKKVEGVVSLIFVVDANGKVENPRVEKSSHEAFEKPAIAAVRKWKFEPGVRAGERVASKMRVSIRFPAS